MAADKKVSYGLKNIVSGIQWRRVRNVYFHWKKYLSRQWFQALLPQALQDGSRLLPAWSHSIVAIYDATILLSLDFHFLMMLILYIHCCNFLSKLKVQKCLKDQKILPYSILACYRNVSQLLGVKMFENKCTACFDYPKCSEGSDNKIRP